MKRKFLRNEFNLIQIDTPKFSFVKYKDDGSIDYPSPIPFTVNYGRVLNTKSDEGDNFDAILLGERVKKGTIKEVQLVGKIDFYDRGIFDPKYVYSKKKVSGFDRINVFVFFNLFAICKNILNKVRGKKGKTKLVKIIL